MIDGTRFCNAIYSFVTKGIARMASQWFIKRGRKTVGPISNSKLLEMVRDRKVTENTQIRKGASQWVAAITITGLFQKAGVFTGDYRCPTCGKLIAEPPTTCESCHRLVESPTQTGNVTEYNTRLRRDMSDE